MAVFGTLLILIFLGASYFFIYVPNNEKTVQERRFRCLQIIDNNIHFKIDNSISLIKNLLLAYPKNQDNLKIYSDSLKRLNDYITQYSQKDFTLLRIQIVPAKQKNAIVRGDSPVTTIINADSNSQQFTLTVSNLIKGVKETDSISIGIRYRFDQFIKPLLAGDTFDNYVVFNNSQREVYETFPSGLNYKIRDSLLEVKNKVTSPGVRSLTIGGRDYKAFSQPVRVDVNNEWLIVGLVSAKNYQKEKSQLPLWTMVVLLTATVITIVSLPWLKLYQMGSKDKLTVVDGVSSILVSMLLMSLLFFVFIIYAFRTEYGQLSKSVNKLANRIDAAFALEIDNAYRQLSQYDLVYKTEKTDIINLGSNHIKYAQGIKDVSCDALLRKEAPNMSVKQVYWLDSTGMERNNWTTDSVNALHANFSERDYFKNIVTNRPNSKGKFEFYLDQVVSRTTGAFTSVIAKKALKGNFTIAAMTFTAKSLDSVIMPDGYQFAVINEDGDVLYHYHPDRNLNENLKKEFADSSMLVSCLEAKSDTNFTADYFGKQYKIKIKPLSGLPYFLVIFEDTNYNDTRDIEDYSFTVSMLIYLLTFQLIQFLVVFLASSKRSFFKKQFFDTSWIGPKTTSHREYNLAIISNGTLIILLIIFFQFSSFLCYIYILLFSVTFISIFLNSIFAAKYKERAPNNYRYKMIAVKWLCIFVNLIDYFAWKTLDHENFWLLLSFEFLAAAAGFLSCKAGTYLLDKLIDYKSRHALNWSYTNSFALMATTRLIVTSGIPVVFFFIYSFNYEQNLITRDSQLTFASSLTQKMPPGSITKPRLDSIQKGQLYTSGVYYDGIYVNKILPVINGKSGIGTQLNDTCKYTKEDYFTIKVLSAVKFYKNSISLKNGNLNSRSVNNEVVFSSLTHAQNRSFYTICNYKKAGYNFSLISLIISDYPAIIFWLVLSIPIIGFYYVIHNIIRKLFALNLPSKHGWENMDEKLLHDNKLNSLLFILGSPGSGKLNKLKKVLKRNKLTDREEKELLLLQKKNQPELWEKKFDAFKSKRLLGNNRELLIYNEKEPSDNNVFIADMILISPEAGANDPDWKACKEEALRDCYSLIIINHFEYNIKDDKTNSIKLDLLESLMQKGRSKVIIVSTVHPITFLDSYNDQQGKETQESELERWHVLLGHFRIVVEPLQFKNANDDNELRRTVMEETQYSHYLNNMQKMTLENLHPEDKELGEISDSLIFKLQITSHYFYTYIWQSLTKEEKFLLYDLAEDGLVNPYDDYNLSMLMCKGLIIKPKGTLMLFNKGFRNFILTAIGNAEANRIKDQVKDNGNWGSLKIPLIIAVLAILVFLIASQQEAYTKIITYVTAIGAGVPAILKVVSLFQGSSPKAQ